MKEYPEVDNGIARIKLVYEWATGCCISFIIADDKEVQEYIKASILSSAAMIRICWASL